MAIEPPDSLLRARRALEDLPFYELVEDWVWNEFVQRWALRCRLIVEPAGLIPASTNWYVLVDGDYPWGDIELHPSKDGGLAYTFPHQSYNSEGNADVPWRDGKICAQTSMRYAGRRAFDLEPFSVDERLRWRLIQAREWLRAAAAARVAEKGEPFELPDFPRESIFELGFIEDEDSYRFWQQQSVTFGVATIVCPESIQRWAVIASFLDARKRPIRTVEYGSIFSHGSTKEVTAMWIRLPDVPVLPPWQAPATFGELRAVMEKQGVDFKQLFFALAPDFRDGKRHLLLVGFSVPAVVGDDARRYHWQSLRMPILTRGNVKGFRPLEKNFALNDVRCVMAGDVTIDWVKSRNWDEEQIRTRGRASSELTNAKVLLLGGGAMGSSIAELLVREGCKRLAVVDGDLLQVGNLCRHTLSLRHIQKLKADSLAVRLNSLSPHVTVEGFHRNLQDCTETEQQQLAEYDIIVDSTGDDRAAYQLSVFPWIGSKLFVSVSLGLQAHRLFVFAVQDKSFPHSDFVSSLRPWLDKELKEHKGFKLPREGLGCWHPVFPARADDVWLMSSVGVKCINTWAVNPPRYPCLSVYEQEERDGLPAGVRLMDGL